MALREELRTPDDVCNLVWHIEKKIRKKRPRSFIKGRYFFKYQLWRKGSRN